MTPAEDIEESAPTSRRDLIHGFLKHSGAVAIGVVGLPTLLDSPLAAAPAAPRPEPARPLLEPAVATERLVDRAELGVLAEDLGLGARKADLLALARNSARLEVDPPVLAEEGGAGTVHLLSVDLAAVAAATPTPPGFPVAGVLRLAADLDEARPYGAIAPASLDLEVHPGVGAPGREASRWATPSAELLLPRVWSPAVEALDLAGEERDAWERLRGELAARQGVVPFDLEPAPRALHRLLGIADDRRGWMPLACALRAAGIDTGSEPAAAHPRAAEMGAEAAAWQLLAQVTLERERDGGTRDWKRLYVWIHRDRLAAGDLSASLAFLP